VEGLHAIEARLVMYVNRSNSAWAEAQSWQPPDLWGEEEVDIWLQVGLNAHPPTLHQNRVFFLPQAATAEVLVTESAYCI
jgi:hypothetical protein